MSSICHIAESASMYVAGWLRRQPSVKEESITDWLLDYLDQHNAQIRYYQFSRHEEGRFSGADWDWWILYDRSCFKLRVQAKKVNQNHNHYAALAHSNKGGYQLDLLLDSSSRLNFYPIYSLYGSSEGVERCQRTNRSEVLHICSAQEVYDLVFGTARVRIESTDLLKLAIPLPCLFCCPPVWNESPGDAQRLFAHYFQSPPRTRIPDSEGEPEERRGYEAEIPEFIERLFEIGEINSNTEGLLREYESMFAGSNGVAIAKISSDEVG